MRTKFTEIGKWVLFNALCLIGTLAFCVLAGENDEMPIGSFCLYKLAAMAVMYLCYCAGKALYAVGLLPRKVTQIIEEDEEI